MRILLTAVLALFVAACSSTPETTGQNTSSSANANNAGSAVPGSQAHLEQVTSTDRVLFGYDQYALTPDAQAQVALWADWMKANPGAKVLVEGHTDERGTRDYNLALGARRSFSVEQALVARGIDSSRVESTSFGKERPAVAGSNEQSWAENRRAVVVVTNSPSS